MRDPSNSKLFMHAKRLLMGMGFAVSLAACGGGEQQPTTTVVTGGNGPSEINALAAPAALSNPNITTVTPAHGSTTASPTSSITINFAQAPVKALIEKAFSLTPGMYNTNPAQKLTLTSMCASRWRVRNPNINDLVVFTWDVYKTTQLGSGIVPGGADVYFQTTGGTETARVFVNGVQHSLKANNPTVCTGSTPSDVPGAVTGTKNWSTDGKTFTFQPTPPTNSSNTALNPGASYTSFLGLDKAQASTFTVGQQFKLLSVGTTSFKNDVTTDVTINGAGFNAQTAFFLQSNKLEVVSISDLKAVVRVPAGFLPSVYGLMAANPDGGRTTLYPAFTIVNGAQPPTLDPQGTQYRSFVEGYVTNYANGQPLADATVGIPGLKTTTTSDGYYLLRGVPQGRQAIKIEAQGFETVYRIAEVNGAAQTLTMKTAALEPFDTNKTLIGPAGGTHNASNGAFLKIPPGALDNDVNIQFTHLRAAETLPELPQNGSYLAFAHLGPTGLVFKKPATLYLPLPTGIVIPVGQRINIFYYDAKQAKWVDDITSGVISNINGELFLEYEINHFTWIGGSWYPTPVDGQVVYNDGKPAPGYATKYGVTGPDGVYKGSITQSSAPYTLVNRVDVAGTSPVTAQYNDNLPSITFPTITLPFAPNDLSLPPGESLEESDCPPKIKPFADRAKSASFRPLRPTDVSTLSHRLVVAQNTFGFKIPINNLKSANVLMSSLRLTLDGVDYTQRATFDTRSANVISVNLKLDQPLHSQVGLEVKLQGLTYGRYLDPRGVLPPTEFSSTQILDVIAKFAVAPIHLIEIPDYDDILQDASTPTPVSVFERGSVNVLYKKGDALNNIKLNIPIIALDEQGQTMPVNVDSVFLGGLSNGATSGEVRMKAGVAVIPLTLNAPSASEFNLTVEGVLASNISGASSSGLGVTGSNLKPKPFLFLVPVVVITAEELAALAIAGGVALYEILNPPQPDTSVYRDWIQDGYDAGRLAPPSTTPLPPLYTPPPPIFQCVPKPLTLPMSVIAPKDVPFVLNNPLTSTRDFEDCRNQNPNWQPPQRGTPQYNQIKEKISNKAPNDGTQTFQSPNLKSIEDHIAPQRYDLSAFGPNKILAYADQLKTLAQNIATQGPKLLTKAAYDIALAAAGTKKVPRISIYGHMIFLQETASGIADRIRNQGIVDKKSTKKNPKPPICFPSEDLDTLQVMLDLIMDILEQYNKL
jgi:hypothetical protein